MIPEAIELQRSNDILDDAAALQTRMESDGYLFFRNVLDSEQVWDLRLKVLRVLQEDGWLKASTDLADGVVDVSMACAYPEPGFMRIYNNIQRLEAFHRLPQSPVIMGIMEKLVGEEVLSHPFKIGRIMFPKAADQDHATSLAHQDWVPIQGTLETYTCWTPIGDCPRELGGLLLLVGSHKSGVHDHHLANGPGGRSIDIDTLEGEWVTTDFKTGDILIFNSLNVHLALPNLTADRIRISTDNRYSGISAPVAENSITPHGGELSWEDVYARWESKALQYYWKKYELNLVSYDTSYNERRDAEAIEQGMLGNEIARAALLQLRHQGSDPEKVAAADRALNILDARRQEKAAAAN